MENMNNSTHLYNVIHNDESNMKYNVPKPRNYSKVNKIRILEARPNKRHRHRL